MTGAIAILAITGLAAILFLIIIAAGGTR